ncbi:protein of unknown function [Alteromonadaceae bacterium Bs31]|nr:protein of unknown function [Alteromonadaceae bacterium Bs31]
MQETPLLHQIFEKIDAANAADPNLEHCPITDTKQPKELLYGRRMSVCLASFSPNASDYLQIAARAQHIERWKSPRSDFPEGRSAYKKWRSQLGLMHAARAAELMSEVGYSEQACERVKFLIQKRQLRRDEETQTLEDVICLVFLEHHMEAFTAKHSREKVIDILQKTWQKMSPNGHKAALKLPLSDCLAALVSEALDA